MTRYRIISGSRDSVTQRKREVLFSELAIVGFAGLCLVAAELILSTAIRGTNFDGADGKMAQALIFAAQRFGGFLQFNNINPIQGLGSQLLPINVWINPTYWPFAVLDKTLAANASAAVALGIFAIARYVMARCFDVPIIPSAIAAQLTIVLFAPMLFVLQLSTVFSLMVGHAVVNAPYMVALGLLARLEPGSWRSFGVITASIFALLIYSLCCDSLWSIVCCSSWALPFAIVAFSPMRPKAVLVRLGALGSCAILLIASGIAEYLYTLVFYTARVQFPAMGDRVRSADFEASVLFYSPYMKYFYLIWVLGWLLGVVTLRGRTRVLVIVGMVSCGTLLAEVLVYLLLQNAPWPLPVSNYVEQSLFPLFLVSAVAGYWGALRTITSWPALHRKRPPGYIWAASLSLVRPPKIGAALAVVAVLPAGALGYAFTRPPHLADQYNEPWADEPELAQFLVENTAQDIGQPFKGAVLFYHYDYPILLTITNLWLRKVPTVLEYGQLVTPQSEYFNAAVLNNDMRQELNLFRPRVVPSPDVSERVLPMLGTRYFIVGNLQGGPEISRYISFADQTGSSLATQSGQPVLVFPQGSHHNAGAAARWRVYELPHPNVGNYSPTQLLTAETAAAAAAIMRQPDFDPAKQAVLSTKIDGSLVAARNMQMSLIRGGLHVSGHSSATSLVLLPQQFSHCLRARDGSVRLMRANLMLTGMIFSGSVDTDILFDYGVFTPRCRWADLSDISELKMQVDARRVPLSGEGVFPDWQTAMANRAAINAIK
jgi:hypothetical protein